jgi:hypothetical protein
MLFSAPINTNTVGTIVATPKATLKATHFKTKFVLHPGWSTGNESYPLVMIKVTASVFATVSLLRLANALYQAVANPKQSPVSEPRVPRSFSFVLVRSRSFSFVDQNG